MLDSLSYWDPCTSSIGRAWLSQVLQRHDIARLLEPILLLLLHPKTHRVSIQRVQAQRHWAQVFPEPPEQELSDPVYTRDSGFSERKSGSGGPRQLLFTSSTQIQHHSTHSFASRQSLVPAAPFGSYSTQSIFKNQRPFFIPRFISAQT